jgi:tRNA modification GTPase
VSTDVIERLGIEVAEQYLENATLVLVCGDDASSLAIAVENIRLLTTGTLLVVGTKSDAGRLPLSLGEKLDYVTVSARTGDGLADLVQRIIEILDRDYEPASADTPVLTRERHRVALTKARAEVDAFLHNCTNGFELPATVAAVHLHSARGYLEELVGILDVEEVLDRVFSSFCVGK